MDWLIEQCLNTDYNFSTVSDLFNDEQLDIEYCLDKDVIQIISMLSPEQPFLNFDLKLTSSDIELLNQIHVDKQAEYLNFGKLKTIYDETKIFAESLSIENKNLSSAFAELVSRLVAKITTCSTQGESAWVLIRASIANDKFDLPDWHVDPCISLDNCAANEYNAVLALKGPSTLFYPLQSEARDEFILKSNVTNYLPQQSVVELQELPSYEYLDPELLKRQELAKMLNLSTALTAPFGHGTLFLLGDAYGAVHTTPPIDQERIFIAILPSSKEKIKKIEETIKLANTELANLDELKL